MSASFGRLLAATAMTVALVAGCSSGGSDEKGGGATTSSVEGSGGVADGRLRLDGSGVRSTLPGPDDGHGPDEPGNDSPVDQDDVRTVTAPWAMSAKEIREGDESATRVLCPPGGSHSTVWGTDIYSDDSSVCTAAVHRGLLDYPDGGEVLIEHRPGLGSYQESTRHGVTTRSWDAWPGSFVFIGARGVAIEGE